jgi:hypothetical protein
MTPRIFVTMISAWLIVSGFAWPHSRAEIVNLIGVGVLAPFFAWFSIGRGWARYLSAALGIWLILTTLRFGVMTHATIVHNLMVGASIFVANLVAADADDIRQEHELYGRT